MNEEILMQKSVRDLKSILTSKKLSSSGCLEKTDLVRRIVDNLNPMYPTRRGSRVIAGLECILVSNSDFPEVIVVLNHGYGADADNLSPIGDDIVKALENTKKVLFVFPNAPMTVNGNGKAWFELNVEKMMMLAHQKNFGNFFHELPNGMEDARNSLIEIMSVLVTENNLQYSDIVLGGFSQGSIMSVDVALRLDENIKKLLVFSGCQMNFNEWEALIEPYTQRTSGNPLDVYQSHGSGDPVIPFPLGNNLNIFLRETCSMNVEFDIFPGSHGFPPNAIQNILNFIL